MFLCNDILYGSQLDRTKESGGGSITNQQIAILRDTYVRAMEHFANDSLLLPEQIWDGISDVPVGRFTVGEGTNSATPLAWPHDEYIKLVRSYRDKANFSKFQIVAERYISTTP